MKHSKPKNITEILSGISSAQGLIMGSAAVSHAARKQHLSRILNDVEAAGGKKSEGGAIVFFVGLAECGRSNNPAIRGLWDQSRFSHQQAALFTYLSEKWIALWKEKHPDDPEGHEEGQDDELMNTWNECRISLFHECGQGALLKLSVAEYRKRLVEAGHDKEMADYSARYFLQEWEDEDEN